MLAAGVLVGCAYEDEGDPAPTETRTSVRPAAAVPTKGPDLLAVEDRNYAALGRRLGAADKPVLLVDGGPADGPGVGFRKTAKVTAAGPHTVTAACVGLPGVQIYLTQEVQGGSEGTTIELDCSGTHTQVVQLQEGYVGVHLVRYPDGAWTGGVAGIKITVG
jgi:hypothetical protein